MSEEKDIRWKQRFQNLGKAKTKFEFALSALAKDKQNELYQMALIQTFEFTFELAWKTIKDYLKYGGVEEANLPREVIKHAFNLKIIENGQAWIDMLEDRNLMAHTYDDSRARKAVEHIVSCYHKEVVQLYEFLEQKV
ncbi:MAG: nucleotidyltransferase substrate binding protein [Flavobacteriales bacterium]|nr:nucleotidyltransferase substrate binding protein [Flavobacteriales bacterium]